MVVQLKEVILRALPLLHKSLHFHSQHRHRQDQLIAYQHYHQHVEQFHQKFHMDYHHHNQHHHLQYLQHLYSHQESYMQHHR